MVFTMRKSDLLLSIREMTERHWSAPDIASKLHISVALVLELLSTLSNNT